MADFIEPSGVTMMRASIMDLMMFSMLAFAISASLAYRSRASCARFRSVIFLTISRHETISPLAFRMGLAVFSR